MQERRARLADAHERRGAELVRVGDAGDGNRNRGVAELASSLGIVVVAVDEPRYGDVEHVADPAAAAEYVTALGAPLAVLVKGSRVAALERVAELLA